ncbi:MAG: site-2 protease family protein [Dehalococcoidia bacterium]|nr:site-2 protease family protein [Dehalococcoidia bacterium]
MIPATLIFGILTFLLVLGPLIILHELGHFFTAKWTRTKVVEFGFGFPPRATGLWTGATEVSITEETIFEGFTELESLETDNPSTITHDGDDLRGVQSESFDGRLAALEEGIQVEATVDKRADGSFHALLLRPKKRRNALASDVGDAVVGDFINGKLRAVGPHSITISEMVWSINWLPLGGFVKMVGEEDPEAENSLASKSKWARSLVLSSGAIVNAIIPIILFTFVLMLPQTQLAGDVTITAVYPDSPADQAGLRVGDRILEVDGRDIDDLTGLQQAITLKLGGTSNWLVRPGIPDPSPMPGATAFQYIEGRDKDISLSPRYQVPDRDVVFEVTDPENQLLLAEARLLDITVGVNDRLRVVLEATDTSQEISITDARLLDNRIALGDELQVVGLISDPTSEILLSDARRHDFSLGLKTSIIDGSVGIQIKTENATQKTFSNNPWDAFTGSFREIRDLILLTKNSIAGLVQSSNNPQLSGPATVGPIGIGQLTGEIAVADAAVSTKLRTFAVLAATISLSLTVINILPLPGLDGGRLLFVAIEAVRGGKRISPEREAVVHLAGILVLLSLMALISVQDVMRIFRGESFF